jgi:RNA polymerase sigma-70 factor (ECF subfamily)
LTSNERLPCGRLKAIKRNENAKMEIPTKPNAQARQTVAQRAVRLVLADARPQDVRNNVTATTFEGRNGDQRLMPSAFAEDLVALLPRLRRFALSLAGSAVEADDLVQAACERALRARDQWMPGTRLDSWVFRIMQNLWIDAIRKRKTEGVSQSIDGTFDIEGADGRVVTEAAMTLDRVRSAMNGLPEEQRAVLLLVCADEHSYQETADMLEVPIGTVMSRLARARRNLATTLHLDGAQTARVTTHKGLS